MGKSFLGKWSNVGNRKPEGPGKNTRKGISLPELFRRFPTTKQQKSGSRRCDGAKSECIAPIVAVWTTFTSGKTGDLCRIGAAVVADTSV